MGHLIKEHACFYLRDEIELNNLISFGWIQNSLIQQVNVESNNIEFTEKPAFLSYLNIFNCARTRTRFIHLNVWLTKMQQRNEFKILSLQK